MSKSTISMYELFAIIPDAETARLYLESEPEIDAYHHAEAATAGIDDFLSIGATSPGLWPA
jgi:hypothetical protein